MSEWYSGLANDDARKAHAHYRWSDASGLCFADNFAGPDDGRESRPRDDISPPVTGQPCKKPSTGWRWDAKRTEKAMLAQPPIIHFGPDDSTVPCRKSYLQTINSEAFQSVFYRDGRGATVELVRILEPGIFDFPKDPEVIGKSIELCTEPGATALDFSGGSGTSMIAAIRRAGIRSILVQIPEATDEDSPARRDGLTKISEVTIDRVKRVIEGYGAKPQPLSGTGFKVFKLTKSNFPRSEITPDPKASEEENVAARRHCIRDKEAVSLLP